MELLLTISLFILAVGVFTSVSITALFHLFVLIPMGFYLYLSPRLKKNYSQWALWGVVFSIVLSVLFNPEVSWKVLLKTKYFIISLLVIPAFRYFFYSQFKEKRLKALIYTFLIATTIASLSGIIGLYTGFNPLKMKSACHATRACGLFGMYMTYAYGISFVVTLLLAFVANSKMFFITISKYLIGIAVIINGLGLALSYTRGAWIGLLCSIPFLLDKKNLKKVILVSLGLILLSFSLFTIPRVRETFLSPARLESNAIRISQYKAAWFAFKDSPIVGVGYRNFEPLSSSIKVKHNIEFPEFAGHAHNNLLEHLASTGIIGFLALLAFMVFWALELYKRDDIIARLSLPVVVNFMISGLFQYTFGDGENLFFLMALYTITQMKPRKSKVLFLDRDGILIKDVGYPHKESDIELLPETVEMIKDANRKRIPVVVVTNQAGIAKGKFSLEQYTLFEKVLRLKLAKLGARISHTYFCPFHPDGIDESYTAYSRLRKPGPEMIEIAQKNFNIDLKKSVMVGDKKSDVFKKLPLKSLLLRGNYDLKEEDELGYDSLNDIFKIVRKNMF